MKSWRLACVVALSAVLALALLPGCGAPSPAPGSAPTAAPGAPAAQAPTKVIEWRMHTPWGDTRPEYGEMMNFAKAMGEATGGRLKITPYPAGALGFKDADMLRLVGQQGSIEAFVGTPTYVMQDEPALGLMLPHMAFQRQEDVVKVIPRVRPMAEELYKKHNIHVVSEMIWNFKDVYIITKGPWNSLAQLKGKKVRTWASSQADTLNKVGAAASVLPQSELYLAMKTGVFDGALHTSNGVVVLSLNEVATHMTSIYAPAEDELIGINENVFKSLPADLQQILTTKGKEWTAKWLEMTKQPLDAVEWNQKAKDKGMVFLPEFPAEDRAALRKAAFEVWKEEGARYGGNVIEIQTKVEVEMKQLGIQ